MYDYSCSQIRKIKIEIEWILKKFEEFQSFNVLAVPCLIFKNSTSSRSRKKIEKNLKKLTYSVFSTLLNQTYINEKLLT